MQACMPVTAPAEEAAGPQMAEPVKLTLWQGSWLWDEYFPTIGPNMEAAGIMPKVEVDNPPIGWEELFEKYWLAGEAGVFPDLIWAHPSMMVRSLNNDAWLPVPKEAISYDWINESFIQQSLDQLFVNDSYYLICWEMATMALQVNRTILQEAGFDSEPTNFEEFLEDGEGVCEQRWRQGVALPASVSTVSRTSTGTFCRAWGRASHRPSSPPRFRSTMSWAGKRGSCWPISRRKHDVLHFKFGKAWEGRVRPTYRVSQRLAGLQQPSTMSWRPMCRMWRRERSAPATCMPQIGPDGYRLGIAPNWGMVVTSATAEEKRDAAWQVYKYGLTKENLLDYISYTNTPPTHVEIAAMGADAFQGDRAVQYAVELADAICCGKVFALPPDIPLWDSVHETIYEKIVFDGMSAQTRWRRRCQPWKRRCN